MYTNEIKIDVKGSALVLTALPQFRSRSPSDALCTRLRTMAMTITSMRKTTVVRNAARVPMMSVSREGRREVPFDPRRRIKREVRRVRKVRAQAEGK